MCRAIHRRCSSKSPEPQCGSSLTRSTAADVDRPTPPEPGRTEAAGGPPDLSLVVALICAPPSVGGHLQDAMPRSAPRHARELAGRSAAGAGPERPDLSQGAGSGTNGGRSRGRRKRHQHSDAARAVPRTGRPSGGCADLGAPAVSGSVGSPLFPVQGEQLGVDDSGGANPGLADLRLQLLEELGVALGHRYGRIGHYPIYACPLFGTTRAPTIVMRADLPEVCGRDTAAPG